MSSLFDQGEPLILGWFDDDPKKQAAAKIDAGKAAFIRKHGFSPSFCHVNARDAAVVVQDLEVRVVSHVRPNNYQIGGQPPQNQNTDADDIDDVAGPEETSQAA